MLHKRRDHNGTDGFPTAGSQAILNPGDRAAGGGVPQSLPRASHAEVVGVAVEASAALTAKFPDPYRREHDMWQASTVSHQEPATNSDRQELLDTLEKGPRHRFSDWPNPSVPKVAAGVYTVWEHGRLIYVGMSGRGLAAPKMSPHRTSPQKPRGCGRDWIRTHLGAEAVTVLCLRLRLSTGSSCRAFRLSSRRR